jgi:dihydropteroate synthase
MSAAKSHSFVWRLSSSRVLALDRPRLMAILNITPDSFSDGGTLLDPGRAAAAGARAVAEGADVLDIGGESTRPGAASVSAAEQMRRVLPVIERLRAELGDGPLVTIDTTLAAVADAALAAGADGVNDVSAGLDDAGMLALCAARGRGVVLMHRRTRPAGDVFSHQHAGDVEYAGGVVAGVREALAGRLSAAREAGIPDEAIVLDPGLGFGKSVAQNLALIRGTPELLTLGRPVLSALSRKSFTAVAAGLGTDTAPASRLAATLGLSVAHMQAGAQLFRVHDVGPHAQALAAALAVHPWALGEQAGGGVAQG